MEKTLLIVGLALTTAGAFTLAYRDFRPKPGTYQTLYYGFPRTKEAWISFPLIVLGTILQIVGVALS